MKTTEVQTIGEPSFPNICAICGSTETLEWRERRRQIEIKDWQREYFHYTASHYQVTNMIFSFPVCSECKKVSCSCNPPKLSRQQELLRWAIIVLVYCLGVVVILLKSKKNRRSMVGRCYAVDLSCWSSNCASWQRCENTTRVLSEVQTTKK
jgi:hypothetical protein